MKRQRICLQKKFKKHIYLSEGNLQQHLHESTRGSQRNSFGSLHVTGRHRCIHVLSHLWGLQSVSQHGFLHKEFPGKPFPFIFTLNALALISSPVTVWLISLVPYTCTKQHECGQQALV